MSYLRAKPSFSNQAKSRLIKLFFYPVLPQIHHSNTPPLHWAFPISRSKTKPNLEEENSRKKAQKAHKQKNSCASCAFSRLFHRIPSCGLVCNCCSVGAVRRFRATGSTLHRIMVPPDAGWVELPGFGLRLNVHER